MSYHPLLIESFASSCVSNLLASASIFSLQSLLLVFFIIVPHDDASKSIWVVGLRPSVKGNAISISKNLCVEILSVFLLETNNLFEESDCSGKEQSREKKDKDTSSYPSSFHNTEVVQSPLHFQGDFTIITKITTAQYFLSMRLHKKMLKHTSKSLPMLKH
ncbi:transmembrane protein, putative [Medicago truncatula]|uniref:Transmembrane protein, putative n=1 Tax=Medicago truncatula TaxID=3880 RepID=G7J125_MEDTR|nr:transmembrane protein, putative [Medicago truncatula]